MKSSIIITGHGHFAEGFKSALHLLVGESPNTYFINFNESFEVYQSQLSKLIDEVATSSEQVIIFTDLAGGSPFNISCLSAKNYNNIIIISGTNLPMVIDTLTSALYDLGEITSDSILKAGQESLIRFNNPISKKAILPQEGI